MVGVMYTGATGGKERERRNTELDVGGGGGGSRRTTRTYVSCEDGALETGTTRERILREKGLKMYQVRE